MGKDLVRPILHSLEWLFYADCSSFDSANVTCAHPRLLEGSAARWCEDASLPDKATAKQSVPHPSPPACCSCLPLLPPQNTQALVISISAVTAVISGTFWCVCLEELVLCFAGGLALLRKTVPQDITGIHRFSHGSSLPVTHSSWLFLSWHE